MSFVLALIIGTSLFAYGLWARQRFQPSRWASTTGVVILSKPTQVPSRYGKIFAPYVRYRYEVGGTEYSGDRYAFSAAEDRGNLDEVNQHLASYSEGTPIPIWHQTANPAVSCLKPFSSYSQSQALALIVAGTLVDLAAVLLLLAGRT